MKKFTVKPRTFHANPAGVGASGATLDGWVSIGRLAEAGPLIDVHFDVTTEHVIAIFGKRGSGKSYTLGTFLEGLCAQNQPSCISHVSRSRAMLLFDTLGVFQWVDVALTRDAQRPVLRQQFDARRGWNLDPEPLDVCVWIPSGTRTQTTPVDHAEFAIQSSDFDASDWGYLLNLDIIQDRMGQLLNDAYIKVTQEGWRDSHRRQHAPRDSYNLGQLIDCVRDDEELTESYAPETRRAVMQQLTACLRNPLFQDEGTGLRELLSPGRLSVVVMNKLSQELRLVLVTALIRKIMEARIRTSEDEKHRLLRTDLSDEQRAALESALGQGIPPVWVVVDEAQNVLPAERRTAATDTLVRLVREGRNFGLSFMFTTQQPTAIDQRILAQVDTLVAHKLTVQTDIDYVRRNLKSNLPDEVRYANAVLSFDEILRALDVGQALVSNTEAPRAFIMDVRPRLTVHGGF